MKKRSRFDAVWKPKWSYQVVVWNVRDRFYSRVLRLDKTFREHKCCGFEITRPFHFWASKQNIFSIFKFQNLRPSNHGRLGIPRAHSVLILGGYGPITKIIENEHILVLSQAVNLCKFTAWLRTRISTILWSGRSLLKSEMNVLLEFRNASS